MEVLKEFLETSTIHGLAYISTAQVISLYKKIIDLFVEEQGCKGNMARYCMPWLFWCFAVDQQVLL